MTENAVVWEVWSDNMIGESEALYAIEKDYDPYCYVCKRGDVQKDCRNERLLHKFVGKTYFKQTEAVAELIAFYGKDLYSVKFGLADTNVAFIRMCMLAKPVCPLRSKCTSKKKKVSGVFK